MILPGSTSTLDSLTPRELEVGALVAEGESHKQVARELGISCQTVRVHVSNAAHKLPGEGRPSIKLARHSHLFFLLADSA